MGRESLGEEQNAWLPRDMQGGEPDGAYGSAVAAFSYPMYTGWEEAQGEQETYSNASNNGEPYSAEAVTTTVTVVYVYGGFTTSVNNGTFEAVSLSSSFNVLQFIPGVSIARLRLHPNLLALLVTMLSVVLVDDSTWRFLH